MTLANLNQYNPGQTQPVGCRAIVVGGSMAGLCAARVLRDSFDEVVVLDRDEFPRKPQRRDGAPQTSQPHAMLEAGRATLEDFFPGFTEAVQSAGGLLLEVGEDIVWYDKGAPVAEPAADLPALYASRPLFEHVVREQIREFNEIQLRGDCHFREYEYDSDDEQVTGVCYRDEAGTERTLDAALIVDATGRNSRTPKWLEAHGYPVPDVDEVEVDVTYSTVRIDRPSDIHRGVLIAPEVHRPRGAAMLPVEGDRWEVLLQGMHGERAPDDRETFMQWAEQLPLDEIGQRLRQHEWVSDIQQYPFPGSIRRHYEAIERFPEGLVVTGDALASFNPVYGQGMSVAALDALVLHHELVNGLDGLGPRFFERTNKTIDEAWTVAVGNDFSFDETTGPKPFGTDLLNRYVNRLIRRAHDDSELSAAFFRVLRLEKSTTSLAHPSVVWRVFRP
ncbi:2-polyprenyl-6-methoxyphenol hydroxylase [Halogranum gelatinilyticum]|uniref:2-polyprenyl-6-methoxyphenol hydroxylase n=1 Tax=Halogranum gelatinilyticum TaxID=660521 RepID=A0A1G9XAP1_9EURY|nr:FAD-dependent monooxygenase [Halogranum gelatinilyticum]SDM93385.1 2-polyprenyl-6-methoxyphenol hydroxylase [Halogranum gelatinilyticum]